MATIVANAGSAGNWTAGGTWIGGSAPTASDDAQITATTTAITIDSGAVCRSADFTGFTGTATHNSGATFTIGTTTAGLSNIALKFVSGMTYTVTSGSTSAINFISTSATVQTIDFAGKNTGSTTFNASSNGSWQLVGTWGTSGVNGNMIVTLTKGTLDLNGQTCFWGSFTNNSGSTRTLTCGASVVTIVQTSTGFTQATAGLTHNTNTSEWILSALNAGINIAGTFNKITITGVGAPSISGSPTIATLTRTGTAVKTDSLVLNADITVTATLTLTGNSSTNRVLAQSNTVGTARTITTTGATVTITNTDFMDIILSVTKDLSAQTDIGDCGGNTGITFPASVSQTWSGTSGGNWSTNAWTTRIPLPQDDVTINAAFSASQTVTADMPRLGRGLNWTGSTGSPTFSITSIAISLFGSYTLISGMTYNHSQSITFAGRNNFSTTFSGKTIGTTNIIFACPTGTYTLNDAISQTSGGTNGVQVTDGTLNTNGFTLTTNTFSSNSGRTRGVTLGSSIINLVGTGASTLWNFTSTGGTYSMANSVIIFPSTNTSTCTFAGGGLTFGTLTYIVAGSTGELDITGSNSFAQINFSDASNARSLKFTAGTTTTIRNTNGFNVFGTSGKNMTVDSITASNHTLTSALQQAGNINYLTLGHSTVDASPKWYAGANSTDGGTNTNWIFTAAPTSGGYGSGSGSGSGSMLSMKALQNLRSII